MNQDVFMIGGEALSSRLFIGTGKYGADSLIPAVCEASGAQVINVAMTPKNAVFSKQIWRTAADCARTAGRADSRAFDPRLARCFRALSSTAEPAPLLHVWTWRNTEA